MTREDRSRIIVLAIIFAIAGVLGVANGSYLITAMYITTVIIAVFIIKDKDIYNILYAILLVSAFYDYALYVPRIESIYMFHIVLGVFTLISLYKVFKERNLLLSLDRKILVIYGIWFVYACLSIAWTLNRSLSIKYIAIYLMMFAFIVNIMIYNINKERIQKTINLLLFLVSLIIVVAFIETTIGKQLPIRHYADKFIEFLPVDQQNLINARPMAFSFNPNNLSATLALLCPLFFYTINKTKNIIVKIFCMLISIIAFALVAITTSRTGFVAISSGVVVYAIYSIFNIKKIGLKSIVCPIILLISLFVTFNYSYMLMNVKSTGSNQMKNGLVDKMNALEDEEVQEGGEGSLSVRMTIIKDVLIKGTLQEKNYLGYGVGNVTQYIQNQGNTGNIFSPHCYAIEILGDFGVPGVILYGVYYLYLLIGNIIIGIKKKKIMCFVAASGLIAFAPASFGPSSITYVFSYWILMGFAVSCIQVYKNENDNYGNTSSMKEYRMV
ncbi:teichuronic acid biosynthesis protein TuaE [Clostridium puniceum]|uniref:Teichuronic acid biosynthesis protein TuaE n=1 Tax=Clostridium puniceum TaxID=29367 RepID=A0A1S8TI49_9CLOT|nr:O-antigen ligase family protein [Clostridium puniceum]OOM77252.1 teichuronic acid biosynthesis protein TuaE [Clostridium puniceum]